MSALGRSNAPSLAERRSTQLAAQAPRRPSSSARPRLPHRASKNSSSHASPKCARLWFPGKGTRNMAPQVPGLFYSSKLQANMAWWKMPHNFASKKVLRWVEHGVKVEFKKGLPFAPKPSAPKFVDPQDVDFAIQDLLKGRRIGAYQDLAPGGDQFLSRSRVHTPPSKGKQRIVHALCSLNETTVKRQTSYEDLRMLKSVVKPQDFIGYFVCSRPDLAPPVPSAQTPLHLRHLYHQVVEFSHAALPLGWTSSPRIWTSVMSVVAAALRRHGMRTLLHVDDLLIACSSFEEASRARQIIEDTLLVTGIVRARHSRAAPILRPRPCPTIWASSSPPLAKETYGFQRGGAFALCRQARAALRDSQESSPRRLRPPSTFLRDSHLLLASSSDGSLSPPRSLQRARAVQAKIFPLSAAVDSLLFWRNFSAKSPENLQKLWPDQPSTALYTDASGTTGWGSVLEPPNETTRSSAGWWASQEVLEMIALTEELKAYRHGLHQNVEALRGRTVKLYQDNQVVTSLWSAAQNVIQVPSTHGRDQGPRTLAPRKQDPSRRGLHSK
jgi:hypothetical protein